MKQTIKTSRTAGQLEKMFRALNAHFFAGELEEPIITLKNTPGAYGHITCGKVWQAGENRRYEINIGTATLYRPIEEITATLLHEMCHEYNLMHDIQDCSRGGSYHNKKFKACAEKHGLLIEHHEKYGWTITSPSLALLGFVEMQGWQDIEMNEGFAFRIPGGEKTGSKEKPGEGTKPPRKPSSTRKYICPKCGNSCRATKAINIMCMDCHEQMQVEQ